MLTERELGVRRSIFGRVPYVAASAEPHARERMFDDAMSFVHILVNALVLKVADRVDATRIGRRDACARDIARQRVAVTRPGRERVEEVVVYEPTNQTCVLASRGRGAR